MLPARFEDETKEEENAIEMRAREGCEPEREKEKEEKKEREGQRREARGEDASPRDVSSIFTCLVSRL